MTTRLGGYYNDDEIGREGRYITRGFLSGYPGSYDRFGRHLVVTRLIVCGHDYVLLDKHLLTMMIFLL